MASLEFMGVSIEHLRHSAFCIRADDETIYIDPIKLGKAGKADLVLVTHSHFDHFDPESVKKLMSERTIFIAPKDCYSVGKPTSLLPGESRELGGISVEAHHAYNTNKFRSEGQVFHPKGFGVGYLVKVNGVSIYHCGDTDNIPEFRSLAGRVDILLIPVSGTYVMTAQEASQAAAVIKPKIAIPMHHSDVVGTVEDAKKFKSLFQGETKIL